LATLKSFRGARPKQLIRHDCTAAKVSGRLVAGGLPRDCEVTVEPRGRKVRLDGKSPRALRSYFDVIKAVAFVPADLRLVDGPPDGRRQFLDRAAFTMDPSYLAVAQEYKAALKQKNALLREAQKSRRRLDPAMRSTWNERVAGVGAEVVRRRTEFLAAFAPVFRELHEGITGAAKGRAELRYRGPVSGDAVSGGVGAIRDALLDKMEAAAETEARRGFATVGPHRDDWELFVGGEALRSFGSQGQVRSAALGLRVAQMVLARRVSGICPLFLLDDVSSELDPHRNQQLMDLLADLQAQVLVTTTALANLKMDVSGYDSFRVRGGAVEAG
jgi:DNA replication and repair protein RecF